MKSTKPAAGSAYLPPKYTKAQAAAIQCIARGTASPHQQQVGLSYIIDTVAGNYDQSFRPGGIEGHRETDFAEGRRFVGLQIVKLVKLNLSIVFDGEPGEQG